MTALPSPDRRSVAGYHDPRRLLAAAIVASVGVVILSVAIGRYVIGSRHDLPLAVVPDAHSLVAAVPWIAVIGLLHVLVAFATASGGGAWRRLALATMAVAAFAAAILAVLAGAGLASPITDATRGSTMVVQLVGLAAAYAAASFLAATAEAD